MPQISVEVKNYITDNLYEVKTTTYEIPRQIVCNNQILHYDAYRQEYTNNTNLSISALDFINAEIAAAAARNSNLENEKR